MGILYIDVIMCSNLNISYFTATTKNKQTQNTKQTTTKQKRNWIFKHEWL